MQRRVLPSTPPSILVAVWLALSAANVSTQCAPAWAGGLARAGVADEVLATAMWDPDGGGPLAPRLVVGGRFIAAGAVVVNRIALFDFATATWSALGGGVTATFGHARVSALRVGANGELFAGGVFSHAGGVPAANIARWDGSTWQALGSGCAGVVSSSIEGLALLPNGDLVAAGRFSHAGGVLANHIASWNGTQWSAMSSGFNGALVNAVLTRGNGTVVATGNFTSSGGAPLAYVAAWSGTSWTPLGAGLPAPGYALAERNGTLLASSYPAVIQSWDGTAWTPFGTNGPIIADVVRRMQVLPNGDLLALRTAQSMFRCAGPASPWLEVSDVLTPGAIEVLGANDYVVGGRFGPTSPHHADGIGRWNGSTWQELGTGCDGSVLAAAPLGTGYVLGGRFLHMGGIAANRVARWDGSTFQPLGSGVNGEVTKLVAHGSGQVAAVGAFTQAGGAPAAGFANWNGTAWSTLGGGPGGQVRVMAAMPNGDLLAVLVTGALRRWNGLAWSNHAAPINVNDYPTCIAIRPNGEVILGGGFNTVPLPRGVMRWTGSAWQGLGTAFDDFPWSLALATNGDVYAGGAFTSAGGQQAYHVARWNGTAWSRVDFGFDTDVRALAGLPDGDVLAGGDFRRCGAMVVSGLARWNGSLWLPVTPAVGPATPLVGGGFDGWNGPAGFVALASGDLIVHGGFAQAGDLAAAYAAVLTPGCSPTVASIPTGCIGPAGPLVATAPQPPQVGQTFVAQATGFSFDSIAFPFYGFRPTFLASFSLPLALPGCDLLVALDLITATLPVAGVATSAVAIPLSPSIVGLGLYHQFGAVQWPPGSGITSISFSNGLALAIQP